MTLDETSDAALAKTARGEETRAKILEAALALFRERGYDDTTMRDVARRAGVSLGNAYYYFDSKETLLQGYYARMDEEHQAASEAVLAKETDLKARLLGVLKAKLKVSEPYHRFAGLLFRAFTSRVTRTFRLTPSNVNGPTMTSWGGGTFIGTCCCGSCGAGAN